MGLRELCSQILQLYNHLLEEAKAVGCDYPPMTAAAVRTHVELHDLSFQNQLILQIQKATLIMSLLEQRIASRKDGQTHIHPTYLRAWLKTAHHANSTMKLLPAECHLVQNNS